MNRKCYQQFGSQPWLLHLFSIPSDEEKLKQGIEEIITIHMKTIKYQISDMIYFLFLPKQ